MFSKYFVLFSLCAFWGVFAHPPTCPRLDLGIFALEPSDFFCSSPPEPYVVRPSPSRGLGVFAVHHLETGSIIMREPAVIRFKRPDISKRSGYPIAEVTQIVRKEFEKLSPKEQAEIIGLTYHAKPGELEEVNGDALGLIFRTNAYNTGNDFGIFPKIARINHSCRPNAAYYWSETLNKRVIYATRDILEGEEIFVSYIPLTMSREERQKRLNRYGFRCACSACAQPPVNLSRSDQRRNDINQAFQAFESQLTLTIPQTPSSLRRARKNADSSLELARLVEEESLADYYPMAYRIVAISHARVEDWEKATVWANKAYERRVMEDPASAFTLELHSLTSSFIERWKSQLYNETKRS